MNGNRLMLSEERWPIEMSPAITNAVSGGVWQTTAKPGTWWKLCLPCGDLRAKAEMVSGLGLVEST